MNAEPFQKYPFCMLSPLWGVLREPVVISSRLQCRRAKEQVHGIYQAADGWQSEL